MPTDKPKTRRAPAKRPARASAAAMAMPAHAHADHHAPTHTHSEHHSPAKKEQDMLSVVAVIVTIFGLGLASYDLTLAVNLRNASESMFAEALAVDPNVQARLQGAVAPGKTPAQAPTGVSIPPVLWAMNGVKPEEQDRLEKNLIGPLLADSLANGPTYKVVMLERKNATATNVMVRLFADDGTETAYLFPNTHADKDGIWMSDRPVATPAPADGSAASGTVPADSGVVPAPNE